MPRTVTSPSILLAHEPTHGVDVRTKSDIYSLICRLAAEGMAVIFVSSELPEVLALSSRILVMAKGGTLLCDNRGVDEQRILSAAFDAFEPASVSVL